MRSRGYAAAFEVARQANIEAEIDLLDRLLRLEPHRRREFGEVLIEVQLRDLGEVTREQLEALQAAVSSAAGYEWHRPWDEPINEIFGPDPNARHFDESIPDDPDEFE